VFAVGKLLGPGDSLGPCEEVFLGGEIGLTVGNAVGSKVGLSLGDGVDGGSGDGTVDGVSLGEISNN
jgi:hypothetical protein